MNTIIYKELSYRITGLCFKIHAKLGRFCREKQYSDLFEKELQTNDISYKREYELSNFNSSSPDGNIVDFLVDDKIIIDIKAKKFITKEDYFQIQRYLRAANLKLGLIINFRNTFLKPKRVLNSVANSYHSHAAVTSHRSAFTLIELLVTIGMLGILVTGLMIAINPLEQLKKGRDARRIEELKNIKTALELYYSDYGRYPAQSSGTTYQIVDPNLGTLAWGDNWSPYMRTLPKDPTASKSYRYWVDETAGQAGQTFAVYANLDRAENTCSGVQTEACSNAGIRVGSCTDCAGAYNYAVTSGNTSQ